MISYPCTVVNCVSAFPKKSELIRHEKEVHGFEPCSSRMERSWPVDGPQLGTATAGSSGAYFHDEPNNPRQPRFQSPSSDVEYFMKALLMLDGKNFSDVLFSEGGNDASLFSGMGIDDIESDSRPLFASPMQMLGKSPFNGVPLCEDELDLPSGLSPMVGVDNAEQNHDSLYTSLQDLKEESNRVLNSLL